MIRCISCNKPMPHITDSAPEEVWVCKECYTAYELISKFYRPRWSYELHIDPEYWKDDQHYEKSRQVDKEIDKQRIINWEIERKERNKGGCKKHLCFDCIRSWGYDKFMNTYSCNVQENRPGYSSPMLYIPANIKECPYRETVRTKVHDYIEITGEEADKIRNSAYEEGASCVQT